MMHRSRFAATVAALAALTQGDAIRAQQSDPSGPGSSYAGAPYLGILRDSVLYGDVWERTDLSKRDRSMITIAVVQTMYATEEIRSHIRRGLDNGLSPEEISELITHVALYSGWPTGVNASRVAAEVFWERSLPLGQTGASHQPQPGTDEARDQPITPAYEGAPYLGVLRNSVLYADVWERTLLSKRDRSMITIAVNQANYFTEELKIHMRLGLQNGVRPEEIPELITHVALYSGWPTGVNASRTAVEVFEEGGLPLPQLRR